MYIVNFAMRLLVLAFVFVGGAITFAGPQPDKAVPAEARESADLLRSVSQENSATEQSTDSAAPQDVG